MLRWRLRVRKMTYILVDMITLLSCYMLTELVVSHFFVEESGLSGFERLSFVLIYTIMFVMLNLMFSTYEKTIENFGKLSVSNSFRLVFVTILSTINIAAVLFFLKVDFSRNVILVFAVLILIGTFVNRIIFGLVTGSSGRSERARNIIIVGYSDRGYQYIDEMKKYSYLDLNIIGYVSIKEHKQYTGIKTIGKLDDLGTLVKDYVVDEIAVARPLSYDERLKKELAECQSMGITVTMLLETYSKDMKAQVAMVGSLPVLKFHTVSLNENQIFMKRVLDVLGASIGLLMFGLAYILVGPLIKLETPGPIIFKQDRVGKNGRVFKVWKFRSMGVNAEAQKAALLASNEMDGHMFKMSDDPRITRIGAFIRKTSIDELPQFYNVLRGDMSLVGTRPPTVDEVKAYESRHRKRICITPGITGKWQVSGRSDIADFEEVVRLDTEYIGEWSVWLDIKIMLRTLLVVFKKQGSK